jgi:hypothetical protein
MKDGEHREAVEPSTQHVQFDTQDLDYNVCESLGEPIRETRRLRVE